MHSVCFAARAERLFNLDEFRHAIERLHPADYLTMSYYERWAAAVSALLVEKGLVDAAELEARTAAYRAAPDTPVPRREDPARVERAFAWRSRFVSAHSRAGGGPPPRFRPGDAVRVRNMHPKGHTRVPRYVRDKEGVIAHDYGAQILPDAHAHGGGKVLQPLYAVRFSARELWGDDYPTNDTFCVDLWESYLEPAATGAERRLA
jgi:nitrile hydratase